jgi:hypothetical protein
MNKLIMFFFLISFNAYSIENCNFKDSTVKGDIQKYQPKLSELEVITLAEKVAKKEKITIPNEWCRDVSINKENGKLTWEVFYSGNELDACFSILVTDESRKAYLEYCS